MRSKEPPLIVDIDETTPLTTPAPPDRRPWLLQARRTPAPGVVLLVASFGAFLAFLDSTIVNVAFPDIQASFPRSSLSSLSWVLNAYNIVLASLLVVAGRFADLWGRRRMFVQGIVVFTVASVLCAVAGSVDQLIAFRIVQGIGAALLIPASMALVVEGFDLSRRAHAVGLWGAAAAIASGLGPPAGGALVAAHSWRLVFLVNLPLGVIAVLAARSQLVESRSPGIKRTPDLKGALLLGLAIGLLTTGLIKGPDWGWSSPLTIGAFVLSGAALIGFGLSSRASRSPLLDPALLRVRSFAVGNLLTIVAGTGFYAYLLTHILYLHQVWGYSLFQAGLAVAPAAFIAAAVASVLGKVADRRGHRIVLVPGAVIWALSLFWYLERVGIRPDYLHEWLPGQVLQGIGVGATLPVLGSAALARLPKGDGYATASAVVTSARQLGAVLGIAFLVIIVGTPGPLQVVDHLRHGWLFAACCFAAVAVGSLLLGRTARDPTEELERLQATLLEPLPAVPLDMTALIDALAPLPDSLAELPMFSGLSAEALASLEAAAEDVEVEAGSYLFRQDDPSDALYVLRSGRLQVVQGEIVLTELGRGAVLGELGLLTDDVRSASIRAVRDSTLIRLSKEQFDSFADLGVMTALARGMATRIQEIAPPATSRTGVADVVIAVVGLGRSGPAQDCSAALLEQMSRQVKVVDPGRVDREGLEQAERVADKVLLTSDGTDQAWHDFCLRAADRVVLVTSGPDVVTDLAARSQGCDLVLTGTPSSEEQRCQWFAELEPRSMHAMGDGDTRADLRALAARLTGRSLGLVLGGGGARAFAHLGVIEVLEEAGIPVDRVAGTSMGAAVAGLLASRSNAAEVDAMIYEIAMRDNPVGDYTVPSKGLIRGRRTAAAMDTFFGDQRIEALPREFRCVSVDLLRRRKKVHDRGSVADAVCASMRLPGLYPPLVLDGSLHVDGGVLDNLPVSALARSEGPILAVMIGFGGPSGPPRTHTSPRAPRIPALGDTLMRTMLMASGDAADEAVAAADLVLRPSTAGVGLMELHQIDRMRESGRATTLAALPQIIDLVSR
jgi:NTE family protein